MHPSNASNNQLVVKQQDLQTEDPLSTTRSSSLSDTVLSSHPHSEGTTKECGGSGSIDSDSRSTRLSQDESKFDNTPNKSNENAIHGRMAHTKDAKIHVCPCCRQEAKLLCTRCRTQRYCSQQCQQIHWKETHKHQCKSLTGRAVYVALKNSELQVWDPSSNNNDITSFPESKGDQEGNRTMMEGSKSSRSNSTKSFPLKVQVALSSPNAPMVCYNESRTLQTLIHGTNCKKAQMLDQIIRKHGEAGGAKAYFNASMCSDGRLVIYVDQRLGALPW